MNRYFSGSEVKAFIQDHIKEYFITSPVDGIDLKLDIIGDESLSVESDVTDHYVESNSAYQDQISLKPKIYTVSGEVGELTWYQRDSSSQTVGQVAQRLEGVVSLLPIRSKGFQQMKNTVMKAAQWVDTASNIYDRFDSLTPITNKQMQAYNYLLSWRNIRLPLTVKSPWGILENYVITSLKLTQPKETKDKTIIQITFKEFRTTSVSTVEFDESKYQGNAAFEREPNVDNGKTAGDDRSISRQVTKNDLNNPFHTTSVETLPNDEYIATVTDNVDTYQIWYSNTEHNIMITDGVKILNKNAPEYLNPIRAGAESIKTSIGEKYGNPKLR